MIRNFFYALWDRWANLHPFLRFLLAAGLVAGVALVGGRPAWRAFRDWRMERNLAAARTAVAETRMADARDLSLTVLRAGDPRIDAYRILEKSTAALGDPRHPDIARALMAHPDSSAEDRWAGFRAIPPALPLGVVGQAWVALPEESRRQPRFAVAFADRLIDEGHLGEASAVLLGVPEGERDAAVRLRLVRVLVRSGSAQGFEEAQRIIAAAFPGVQAEAGPWLELLEKIPPLALQPALLAPVREALAGDGEPAARAALVLARLDYAGNFSRRAEGIDAAIDRWREAAPVELARFLGGLGLHSRLAAEFPDDAVAEQPELFLPLLEAVGETGDAAREQALLESFGERLPRYELLGRQSIAAARAGNAAERVARWNAAIEEARVNPDAGALRALHRLAEGAGLTAEAELAMVAAIRTGRGPLPLYADLKPLLQSLAAQERENTLLEICAIYLSLEPANPVLLTQYAYLACLHDLATPETIVKAMQPMAEAFPDELPIQCVLATAHLSAGQAAAAAAVFEGMEVKPEQLAPGYRAAWYATQVATGALAADAPALKDFPWDSLQPSERKRFGRWLRK